MFEFGTPEHQAADLVRYYGGVEQALDNCEKFEHQESYRKGSDDKRAFWRKVKATLKVWAETKTPRPI